MIPYGLDHLRDLHITTSKTDARGEIPRIHQLREDGQARVRRERLRSGGWPSLHPEHLTAQLAICAERRRGPLVGDPAAVEDVDAVGQGQHEVEIVLHDEDRHVPAQPVDGDEDRLADRRGQPFERLVQQQEPEVPRQGARDRDHLLLAAREGLGAAGQALADPGEELEDALGLPPDPVAATPPEPAEHLGWRCSHQLAFALLREVDDDFGFYYGLSGAADGWIGAQLYQSTDGGTDYNALAAEYDALARNPAENFERMSAIQKELGGLK